MVTTLLAGLPGGIVADLPFLEPDSDVPQGLPSPVQPLSRAKVNVKNKEEHGLGLCAH